MVKVICGKKGVGKTRILVNAANNLASESSGDVVFIDGTGRSMYDLGHKVRFINISEFPVKINEGCSFLGFLCGMISEDYDIKGIFVDDFSRIVKEGDECLKSFFEGVEKLSSQFNIEFYFSIEGDPDLMPDYIKAFY